MFKALRKSTVKMRFLLLCFFSMASLAFLAMTFFTSMTTTLTEVTKSNKGIKIASEKSLDLGSDVDKSETVFKLIAATQGVGGLARLQELTKIKASFFETLSSLRDSFPATEWLPGETTKIEELYSSIEDTGKKMTLGFLQKNPELVQQKQNEQTKLLAGLRESLNEVIAKLQVDAETRLAVLFASIRNRALLTIAGIFIALILVSLVLVRETNSQLISVTSGLAGASDENQKSSHELNSIFDKFAETIASQTSSVQQTVSAVTEISSMLQTTTDHTGVSRDSAQNTHKLAKDGESSMNEMVEFIEDLGKTNKDILDGIKSSNKKILGIVEIVDEIHQKTQLINEIVFQTKLLSFNASVEAARAGEHGKGFAVVAEEVGNLARSSGDASTEIEQMLQKSKSYVEDIASNTAQEMERLVSSAETKIQGGAKLSSTCSSLFSEVVKNVAKVSSMMNEISVASQEQTQGVQDISNAMNQIDTDLSQTRGSLDTARSAAQKMVDQAETLSRMTDSVRALAESSKHSVSMNSGRKVVRLASKKEKQHRKKVA